MIPTLELRLRPPPFWTPRIVWVAAAPVAYYVLLGPGWEALLGHPLLGNLVSQIAIGTGCIAIAALLRLATRPRTMPAVQATCDGLIFPLGPESRRTRKIDYSSILGIEIMARGRMGVLLLATTDGPLVLPLRSFRDSHAPRRLLTAVRSRLLALPEGPQVLKAMAIKSEQARQLAHRKTPLTLILLATLAGIFLLQRDVSDGSAELSLVRLGANAPALVQDGQWFRLLSANFLHGGLIHLGMNSLGLLALGTLLERLLGWPRLLLIYVGGAFAGALASSLAALALLSVGASTAVFGLLGSLAFLSLRDGSQLPLGVQQPRQTWLFVVGINSALPLLIPQIDWMAHVGGGLGGAAVTALLVPSAQTYARTGSHFGAWVLRLAALASAGLCVGALAVALPRTAADAEQDWQIILDEGLTRDSAPLDLVNRAAWNRAIAISPSPNALEQARTALGSAISRYEAANQQDSTPVEVLDTLATLHYRLGDFDAAVSLERQVLGSRHEPGASWQIARFAHARLLSANTPSSAAPPSSAGSPQRNQFDSHAVQLLWPVEQESQELQLEFGKPLPNGAEIWLLGVRGEQLLSALVVGVAPRRGPESLRIALPPYFWPRALRKLVPQDVQLLLAVVDTQRCLAPCPPRNDSFRRVKLDVTTANYP